MSCAEENVELEHQMQKDNNSFYNLCKQTIGIAGGVLGIILFSPAFIIIPAIIKVDSKGPGTHKHLILGRDDRSFYFYKFRTMFDDEIRCLRGSRRTTLSYIKNT